MRLPLIARLTVAAPLLGVAFTASPAEAQVGCPPPADRPCITRLEMGGTLPGRPNTRPVTVHWSGAGHFTHYNLTANVNGAQGPQFEVSASAPDQLLGPHRRHTWTWNGVGPGTRVIITVQGCVRGGFLQPSSCSPIASRTFILGEGSGTPGTPGNPQLRATCQRYATVAVETLRMARDFYRCHPSFLTGSRWTSDFNAHFNWCMTATPAARTSEENARTATMHRCRLQPPVGSASLSVVLAPRGDFFTVTGSGFAVNAPVVIRLGGPAAVTSAITVLNGQRIIADARGSISLRLPGVMVCARAGQVTFLGDDSEKRSNTVTATCRPN